MTAASPWARRLIVGVSFGVLALVALLYTLAGRRDTDFLSFYAGARLAGTRQLYAVDSVNRIQREYTNPDEVRAFIRPPFYALALYPLGRLDYPAAQALWQMLNLAAVAGFVWLWFPKPLAAALVCWYFPLWIGFVGAQDIGIVLLLAAWAGRQTERKRYFAAGLILALCGIKAHLFLLAPVLILARRLWKMAWGLAAGAAALLALSFAAGGADWLNRYRLLLEANERNQHSAANMPSLYGLFHGLPNGGVFVALGAAIVIAAVWRVARRSSLEYSWAVMLAGGVLIAIHAFLYDAAMLLPAFLTTAREEGFSRVVPVAAALGLVSLALVDPPQPLLFQLSTAVVFGWLVYRGHQVAGREQ